MPGPLLRPTPRIPSGENVVTDRIERALAKTEDVADEKRIGLDERRPWSRHAALARAAWRLEPIRVVEAATFPRQ